MTEATTTIPAVVATQRINGTILPGTLFVPANEQDHADLVALGAVREPTEAEQILHERMLENTATAAPAKPAGRGRRTAQQTAEAEAAAAAEAEAAAAAEAEAAAAAEAEAAAAAEAANIG